MKDIAKEIKGPYAFKASIISTITPIICTLISLALEGKVSQQVSFPIVVFLVIVMVPIYIIGNIVAIKVGVQELKNTKITPLKAKGAIILSTLSLTSLLILILYTF